MKVKRHKHAKKILTYYRNHFGIHPPYHVVMDGTFCKAALQAKVNIREQLPKYLDSEVKLCTTKCVLAECEAMGPLLYGPFKVLQQFEQETCLHKNMQTAPKCLRRLAVKSGKRKYIVATQDPELSDMVREVPGTPLLYLSHNAMNLEKPSIQTKHKASDYLAAKLGPGQREQTVLDAMKKKLLGDIEEVPQKKRRKKIKGPNPLSCKKKKKVTETVQTGKVTKRKRKRHKRHHTAEVTGSSLES